MSAESQNRRETQAQPGSIRQSKAHMVHRWPLDLTHNLIMAHRSCNRSLGTLTDIRDKSLSRICKKSPIRSRQIRYVNANTLAAVDREKQIHEVSTNACRKLFSKSSKLPKSKQLSEEIESPK